MARRIEASLTFGLLGEVLAKAAQLRGKVGYLGLRLLALKVEAGVFVRAAEVLAPVGSVDLCRQL